MSYPGAIQIADQVASWENGSRDFPFSVQWPTYRIWWNGVGNVMLSGNYYTGGWGFWSHARFEITTGLGTYLEMNAWIPRADIKDISYMFMPYGVTTISMRTWLEYGTPPDGDSFYWHYAFHVAPFNGAEFTLDPPKPLCYVGKTITFG